MSYINDKIKPINKAEYQACTDIILDAYDKKINCRKQLLVLIKRSCEVYKINFVNNAKLLYMYRLLIEQKVIKKNKKILEILRKRKVRTISGIASVAVLTKPYKCPGNCLFCPTEKDVPKSYLSNEPAVMRAILANYDPVSQIFIRLRGLQLSGNPADKIELIVMGGTWSYLPIKYQLRYLIGCFWACNNFDNQKSLPRQQAGKIKNQNDRLKFFNINLLKLQDKTVKELWMRLEKEQKINEGVKHRIVGLTLETRPDYINERETIRMRKMGCTRVELGIQSIYDDVLDLNRRGHDVSCIISATKLLKDNGFKINYHMMPGMYGSSAEKDILMFKKLFTDQGFQPDMLKVYPCVVTKNSDLYKKFIKKVYKPYTNAELINIIKQIKKNIPEYVRIQRLIRDIPAESIVGGSKVSNLRQLVQSSGVKCRCIRCREIKNDTKLPVFLKKICYNASGAKEIFLQYVDSKDRVYALLRLRINLAEINVCFDALKDAAIIREVHTYGPMVELGYNDTKKTQHKGLGKKLIEKAEKIAKEEFGFSKMAVISGIGVRGYYKKLGYKLKNTYMVKEI